MPLPESLRPFRSRSFRIYWAGQAISLIGTWMQQMAQGWVVTRLTSNAWIVGAVAVAGTLPMALLGLVGGQLADKRSRRNILIATQTALMILAFGLGALAYARALGLWHLFVLSGLLGVAAAFDLPAAQAFAPDLVPPEDIPRAIALVQSIFHGSRLIGPAIAGLLIARFGEGSAFIANGLSFLAVIGSLLVIPRDDPKTRAGGARRGASAGAGLGYVRTDPVTRVLLPLIVLCMLFAFPFLVVLMAYYARYVIHSGASGMGSIMSASGFGSLVGSVGLVILGARAWRARIAAGVIWIGGALTGLGLAQELRSAMLFTMALSFGISMMLGTSMQVVQRRVPNEIRGRVMALFGIAMTSVMPLSGFALSATADTVGLQRLMLGCAVAFTVSAGALAMRIPAAVAPAPSR